MGKPPKKGSSSKFKIPDQSANLSKAIEELTKYNLGEKGLSFYSIKHLKPIFAFDYLSLQESNLCFDYKSRTREDLLGFFEGLKKVSGFTYDEMSRNKILRFHRIDFDDKKVKLKPKDLLYVLAPSGRGMSEDELPTLYQFDLQYSIEARAVGFLFKGIFHVVWYDREHVIYPK